MWIVIPLAVRVLVSQAPLKIPPPLVEPVITTGMCGMAINLFAQVIVAILRVKTVFVTVQVFGQRQLHSSERPCACLLGTRMRSECCRGRKKR